MKSSEKMKATSLDKDDLGGFGRVCEGLSVEGCEGGVGGGGGGGIGGGHCWEVLGG